MQRESGITSRGELYGPIEIDRRSLTKLTGLVGVSLLTTGSVNNVNAAVTKEATLKMNIQPTFDRLLVQPVESDERTDSGIIIPRQSDLQEAIVRATGVEADQISKGDKILMFDDDGIEVTIAGEEHLITPEESSIAIIED